jgi:predicted dienelactone hydrolase
MAASEIKAGIFGALLCGALIACSDSDRRSPIPAPEEEEIILVEPTESAALPGPYAVGHMTGEEFDVARDNRSLPYDVWYPSDATVSDDTSSTFYSLLGPIGIDSELASDDLPVATGAAPLLVFSHGSGGLNIQSLRMMEALASHGFIVVSAQHTGNTFDNRSDSIDEAGAKRVPDVSFMLDIFLGKNEISGDPFYERIDVDAIGVLGHSFGGGTALGMVAGFYGAEADERVKAVMPISATVEGRFSDADLAAVIEPLLFLSGTEDKSVPISNTNEAFEKLTGTSVVYQVDIIGAGHNAFAAICDIGNTLIDNGIGAETWPAIGAEALIAPYADACGESAFPITEAQRIQNVYGVAFFRRHLLGQTEYNYYLNEDYAGDNEPDVNYRSRPNE